MKKYLPVILFFFSTAICQSQAITKYILLEEFSTAPCGFCPEGDLFAQQIISNHPAVIWTTHHAGFGTDSMTVPESVTIANAFTTFAPGATIDRGDYPIPIYTSAPYIAISRQKWDSVIIAHLNDPPVVEVLIVNNYDSIARMLSCTVTANFVGTPAAGDLRLNLFLSEDHVTGTGTGYDQTNYYNTTVGHPFYGLGNPIAGYEHHHVMRKVVTGTWGMTGIIPNAPLSGSSYTHTFNNIAIPAGWKENDMDVIAFVSYYNGDAHLRQVINSNHKMMKDASTGETELTSHDNGVHIFPNPASQYVVVNSNINNYQLILTDAIGKITETYSLHGSEMISISHLPGGIYFYKVLHNNTQVDQGKLIIKH